MLRVWKEVRVFQHSIIEQCVYSIALEYAQVKKTTFLIVDINSSLFIGRVLADISVFLSCAMTLSVFNITPHMENGTPIMPDLTQSTGTIR